MKRNRAWPNPANAPPTDRALDILRMEMRDGLLDESLVEVFIEAKVYERAVVVRA